MELTEANQQVVLFPLAHRFEQNYHVAHRLGRYRAGRRMDFATATPEVAPTPSPPGGDIRSSYRPVETERRQPGRQPHRPTRVSRAGTL